MSYRRSNRKLRPPWIQTQLDQGYRPYSFYVEYQRTTPLIRTGGHSSKRGDVYATSSTSSSPSLGEGNDWRATTKGGQTGLAASDSRRRSSSSSSGTDSRSRGSEPLANTDKPAGTSIAEHARHRVAASAASAAGRSGDRGEARLTRGDGRIWYRTGAWRPIGDDNESPPRHGQVMKRAGDDDDDDGRQPRTVTATTTTAASPEQADRAMVGRHEPSDDRPTTVALRTESETERAKWKVADRPRQRPVTASDRATAAAEVTVAPSDGVVGGETRPEIAGVATSPNPASATDQTMASVDWTTSTERSRVEPEFAPTSAGRTADDATALPPADRMTYDDVTYDRRDVTDQAPGQTEADVTAMYSDIPRTTGDAINVDATSTPIEPAPSAGRRPGSESDPDFDTSARNSTDIPDELDGAREGPEPRTTEGGAVSAENDVKTPSATTTSTSTTAKQTQPEVILCSTKHRSKSKKPSHASKPPRRRNRNRKRTRLRNAQTPSPAPLSPAPPSLSKYPLYPLPNPYHPQVRVTEPALVAPPREHSFARNSTFTISGLSSAEVTGIAIGCIVAFWIILGPLVCIICRMRDKAKEKRRERQQEDSVSHTLIEEMIRMELARGRAKLYRTNVDDEREIERLPLQGDCCNSAACNACNGNGGCVINPQDYVIGNRYMEYTPVSLMPAPPSDSDKDCIVNKTYMDSLDIKSAARDTNL